MRSRITGLTMGIVLACAASAEAQVAWDSPLLSPPRPTMGLGLYLIEAGNGGIGAMGQWRTPQGVGLRFGIADQRNGVAAFGGADGSGALTRSAPDFPLDISWVAGVGASAGDHGLLLSLPAGLTVGHTFVGQGVTFVPYLTPRLVLDARFFKDEFRPANAMELSFVADLGIDLAFQPTWLVRFGATLGGRPRNALAIGIVF
jgi:hypothetical protein